MGSVSSRISSVFERTSSSPDVDVAQLAPTKPISIDDFDSECPICFLNYTGLNSISCCKGKICTQCYLDLKSSKGKKLTCPYCSTSKYTVTYTENTTCIETNTTNKKSKSSKDNLVQSECQSPPTPAYITPVKTSPPVVFASVSDRQSIEKEVRGQRVSTVTTSPLIQSTRSRFASFHSNENSPTNRRSSSNASTGTGTPQSASAMRAAHFEEILHSLLMGVPAPPYTPGIGGGQHLPHNQTDADRLEELMILQAIELSLQEAQQANNNPTNPPPPIATADSSSATPAEPVYPTPPMPYQPRDGTESPPLFSEEDMIRINNMGSSDEGDDLWQHRSAAPQAEATQADAMETPLINENQPTLSQMEFDTTAVEATQNDVYNSVYTTTTPDSNNEDVGYVIRMSEGERKEEEEEEEEVAIEENKPVHPLGTLIDTSYTRAGNTTFGATEVVAITEPEHVVNGSDSVTGFVASELGPWEQQPADINTTTISDPVPDAAFTPPPSYTAATIAPVPALTSHVGTTIITSLTTAVDETHKEEEKEEVV